MGLRFRKRIRIAPGLRLNLSWSSKKGVTTSTTVGKNGVNANLRLTGEGKTGFRSATVGLPGTGVAYQHSMTEGSLRDRSNESICIVERNQVKSTGSIPEAVHPMDIEPYRFKKTWVGYLMQIVYTFLLFIPILIANGKFIEDYTRTCMAVYSLAFVSLYQAYRYSWKRRPTVDQLKLSDEEKLKLSRLKQAQDDAFKIVEAAEAKGIKKRLDGMYDGRSSLGKSANSAMGRAHFLDQEGLEILNRPYYMYKKLESAVTRSVIFTAILIHLLILPLIVGQDDSYSTYAIWLVSTAVFVTGLVVGTVKHMRMQRLYSRAKIAEYIGLYHYSTNHV